MEPTVPKRLRVAVFGSGTASHTWMLEQLKELGAELVYLDIQAAETRIAGIQPDCLIIDDYCATVHELKLSKLFESVELSAFQKLPKKKAQWKQEMNKYKGKKP